MRLVQAKLDRGATGPARMSAVQTVSNGVWAVHDKNRKRQQMLLACNPGGFDCH